MEGTTLETKRELRSQLETNAAAHAAELEELRKTMTTQAEALAAENADLVAEIAALRDRLRIATGLAQRWRPAGARLLEDVPEHLAAHYRVSLAEDFRAVTDLPLLLRFVAERRGEAEFDERLATEPPDMQDRHRLPRDLTTARQKTILLLSLGGTYAYQPEILTKIEECTDDEIEAFLHRERLHRAAELASGRRSRS